MSVCSGLYQLFRALLKFLIRLGFAQKLKRRRRWQIPAQRWVSNPGFLGVWRTQR